MNENTIRSCGRCGAIYGYDTIHVCSSGFVRAQNSFANWHDAELARLRAEVDALRSWEAKAYSAEEGRKGWKARAEAAEARLAAAEAERDAAREALRAVFPVGCWCARCGQDIDKPETKRCNYCSPARAALAGKGGDK